MNKTIKKTAQLLFILCLVCTLCFPAFAAPDPATKDGPWVFRNANVQPEAVSDAVSGAVSEPLSVTLNPAWKYAGFAKIKTGSATLYKPANSNGITVCINAGHGTKGGESVKTLCHPDGSAKVSGGTTAAGATHATAISSGTSFLDGTSEASVTLLCALKLKGILLSKGYNVLMIREGADVQLDNLARTVIANNNADCHIALHWDSTSTDKGAFYCDAANVASYRAMEPVASTWQKSHALGEALISGLKNNGTIIWKGNPLSSDLTQISYSTIPSVDIELGDSASDHSDPALEKLAKGMAAGVDIYFGK